MKMFRMLALATAILSAPAAQAATTVVSALLDRPYTFPGPSDRAPTYYTQFLTPRFAFNPGDTLDVTLTFSGGAPLNLGFLPGTVLFTVFGGNGAFTGTQYTSTATFSFINPIGAVNPITGPQTSIFERNPGVNFKGARQVQRGPLSFDGLHLVITLDSAVIPFGPPQPPADSFSAFQVSFSNDVPEPATWSLLIIGFGLAGSRLRRQRSALSLQQHYALSRPHPSPGARRAVFPGPIS